MMYRHLVSLVFILSIKPYYLKATYPNKVDYPLYATYPKLTSKTCSGGLDRCSSHPLKFGSRCESDCIHGRFNPTKLANN